MKPRKDPKAVVANLLKEKYPGAKGAFLAGSIIRSDHTKYSDLDVVVIFESLPNAWRESFLYEDWPVEVFVHDPQTIKYFFDEFDGKSGIPSLPSMCLEGIAIPASNSVMDFIKKMAEQKLLEGPKKLSDQEISNRRYVITDLVDDLREPRSRAEALASASKLYPILADFFLRTTGAWSAHGKTIPRVLKKKDPALEEQFSGAFEALFSSGSTETVVQLSDQILKPFGGFLFDGYRQEAPSAWKKK